MENNNHELKKKLKNYAKENDIEILGFGSKERFDGLDARYNPFSIFPEGKTVILIGKRICRGSLRGVEEGTNFSDFDRFGNSFLENQFVATACYDITRQLENEGWEAVPVFNNPPEVYGMGVPVAEGKLAPNVAPDFSYAAVACGIGEISMNGLIFTPKFGSRQLFQMVITDAELEPDPIIEEQICDRCGKCADVCPLGAIKKDELTTIEICGKKMEIARVDYSLCHRCRNGCLPNLYNGSSKPNLIPALCNRTCLVHLEEEGLIENTFDIPFRIREAWGYDVLENRTKVKE